MSGNPPTPSLAEFKGSIAPDGSAVALNVIATNGDNLRVKMTLRQLEELIMFMGTMAHIAGTRGVDPLPSTGEAVQPIDASVFAFSPGRNPREAILSIQVGPVVLPFAVDLRVVKTALEDVQGRIGYDTPRAGDAVQ